MLLNRFANAEGVAGAGWKMVAVADDNTAGGIQLHIKVVCQSVREATTASGVDNAASPTGRHRWTGLFHPQREAGHYAKTTGRNPEVY